jgi:PqqD family protein of HPr-rel-A system
MAKTKKKNENCLPVDAELQQKPMKRPDVLYRKMDDEGVLYDPKTTIVHVLNATSELIWKYCDGKHDARQIVEEILKKYKVERKKAESDVDETLRQFRELELLGR